MPSPVRTTRLKRVVVIDRAPAAVGGGAGGGWSVLVLRVDPNLGVEHASTYEDHDLAGLAGAISRARADRVVRVIPLGQTMCRPVPGATAPAGDPREVALALELIAEAQMGTAAPVHRRSAGRLPVGGLVAAGWSGNGIVSPEVRIAGLTDAIWVPSVAALSALGAQAGASLAVAAERDSGAIAVVGGRAGVGAGGSAASSVARVTRDDGEDAEAWRDAVEAAVQSAGETLGLGDVSPGDVSGRVSVRVFSFDRGGSGSPRWQLSGVPDQDSAWLDRYGLLLGAGLAAADDDPAAHTLLSMTPEPVIPPEPRLLQWTQWLARPARASAVLAVCAAIVLGWPLAAAWIRHDRLSALAKADRADEAAELAARQQAEFYQLLRDRRWPMTKLLSDLTTTLPQGMTLESVAVEYGQRVKANGTAETSQALTEWVAALRATRIFDDPRTPIQDSTGGGVKFELTAQVAQPLTVGGKTIATPAVPLAPVSSGPSGASPSRSSDDRTSTNDSRSRTAERRGTPPGAAKIEAPAPLSDAEIAAMDRATAMREWTQRRTFPQKHPEIDEETKKRLLDEAEKCQARMKSLAGTGGGS
ncbi:MAG: PilN domain-containing protein [Phycisphaerales bacterium]